MVRTFLSRAAIVVAVSAAAVMNAAPATGQPQDATTVSAPNQQIISANPFGLMLRWWNVEFERKITPSSTWGVGASFLGCCGADFASVNGLWRYYPQGAALSGVYLGARVGVYHSPHAGQSGSALGMGFEVGYSWLLGAHRDVGLSVGVGLTRLVGSRHDDWPAVVPTVRLLNVGIAF
jgi:hypothetical protein